MINFSSARASRHFRQVLAADPNAMPIDDAMEQSFSSVWRQLSKPKQNWFVNLYKKMGLVTPDNNIVVDKFFQAKYQTERLIRQIAPMPELDFNDPKNYDITRIRPQPTQPPLVQAPTT